MALIVTACVLASDLFQHGGNIHVQLPASLVTSLFKPLWATPFPFHTLAHTIEGPSQSSYHYFLPLSHSNSIPQAYWNLGCLQRGCVLLSLYLATCCPDCLEELMIVPPGYCDLQSLGQ